MKLLSKVNNRSLNSMFVFVYGSLLAGLSNHHIMTLGKGKFISLGKTVDKYYLTARGDYEYPYLTLSTMNPLQVNNHILGEIYEIDENCLKLLDELVS